MSRRCCSVKRLARIDNPLLIPGGINSRPGLGAPGPRTTFGDPSGRPGSGGLSHQPCKVSAHGLALTREGSGHEAGERNQRKESLAEGFHFLWERNPLLSVVIIRP